MINETFFIWLAVFVPVIILLIMILANLSKTKIIRSEKDFPKPIDGKIFLEPKKYIIKGNVNLGNTIVFDENCTLTSYQKSASIFHIVLCGAKSLFKNIFRAWIQAFKSTSDFEKILNKYQPTPNALINSKSMKQLFPITSDVIEQKEKEVHELFAEALNDSVKKAVIDSKEESNALFDSVSIFYHYSDEIKIKKREVYNQSLNMWEKYNERIGNLS